MKKLLALALVAGMVAFISCGPSKKDQEAKEKAKQDSIATVEKAKKEADSLAAVQKEKIRLDSLKQDSIAKAEKKKHTANKPKTKPTEEPAKPKVVAGKGKNA